MEITWYNQILNILVNIFQYKLNNGFSNIF